jgi:hypothetical protein
MRLAAFMAVAHQACEFENAQMLGYCRLRDAGSIGQRPYGLLPLTAQPLENGAAGWIREGLEKDV